MPWLLTMVVLSVSLIGLTVVLYLTKRANDEAAIVQAQTNSLRQQEQALIKQAQQVKDSLTPEQQQALRAAHELVDRKGFSWSKLFADLESSLPGSVKVSRIAVRNIAMQSDQTIAELELAVFARSSSTITDMISSMDREGIFQAELLSQNLQKGRGESGTEYELLVYYRPRAGYAINSVAEVQKKARPAEELK